MSDEQYIAEARYLGCDAALAAATWVEMSESDAVSILTDVDPEVMDRYEPPNLSGEMAGESIPEIFAGFPDPHDPEIHDAWEQGRDEVWSLALEGVALRVYGWTDEAVRVERGCELVADRLRSAARPGWSE